MNVPYIPNRKPEDYLLFPPEKKANSKKKGSKLKQISVSDFQKKSKSMGWLGVGKRVIQIGEHDPKSAFVQRVLTKLVGNINSTWVVMQTLYDPNLPVCETEQDITPLHEAWAENQLAEKFEQADLTAKVVFLLKDPRSSEHKSISGMFRRLATRKNTSPGTAKKEVYERTENPISGTSGGSAVGEDTPCTNK
jgi:hypothetical protein